MKYRGLFSQLRQYRKFLRFKADFKKLKKQDTGRFRLEWGDIEPLLNDKNKLRFDAHYFYHLSWASRIVKEIAPPRHVDVSSHYFWGGILSAFVPTEYFEFNAIQTKGLNGYSTGFADLSRLPFEDRILPSISCMHVVEHVGLGRYGDRLDYDGDTKAIEELKRVTKEGGHILFVVPMAEKSRIAFNAHRIYSFEQVVSCFAECDLREFAYIPESSEKGIIRHANPALLINEKYGCGCFHFVKRPS